MLLRPFQFRDYQRLVILWDKLRGGSERETVAPATFLDWRKQATTLEQIVAWEGWAPSLTNSGEPELLQGFRVSPGFFELLGVRPVLGRSFMPDEETPGNHRRVVIGNGLWKRRFGGDPRIVGTEIVLNGESHTIVGVAPPRFDFPTGCQIWAPLAFDKQRLSDRVSRSFTVAGKLAGSQSLTDAQAEMDVIGRRLARLYPDAYRDRAVLVQPLSDAFREGSAAPLFASLLVSSGLVLLVGCMNIGGLLLARGFVRQRELALRAALGASRVRIVRQLVTETVVLGLLSSVLAILFATVALEVLRSSLPPEITDHIEGWSNLGLDPRLLFAIPALAILVGLLVSVIPAITASGEQTAEALKESGRGSVRSGGRQRIRQSLVVAEIAFALALLISAGLTLNGGRQLIAQPGGFDAQKLLTVMIPLPENKYADAVRHREFARALLSRLDSLPGVERAAVANILPASGWSPSVSLELEDHPEIDPARRPRAGYRSVSLGFFETMRIPILQGRALSAADRENTQPVAVVSSALVERFWPGQNPVGRRIRLEGDKKEWVSIVGVADDVAMYNWWDGVDYTAVYVPLGQASPSRSVHVAVRTRGEPSSVAGSLRETVRSIDPMLSLHKIVTIEQSINQSTLSLTWLASLMGICGGIGVTLAVIGIYSMMAYTMAQREHEFGVRIALGATSGDVVRLTLKQAAILTGIGVGTGLALALALGQLMASSMAGVITLDAMVFLAVTPLLAMVSLAAAYVPARRALRLDPAEVLRNS